MPPQRIGVGLAFISIAVRRPPPSGGEETALPPDMLGQAVAARAGGGDTRPVNRKPQLLLPSAQWLGLPPLRAGKISTTPTLWHRAVSGGPLVGRRVGLDLSPLQRVWCRGFVVRGGLLGGNVVVGDDRRH